MKGHRLVKKREKTIQKYYFFLQLSEENLDWSESKVNKVSYLRYLLKHHFIIMIYKAKRVNGDQKENQEKLDKKEKSVLPG